MVKLTAWTKFLTAYHTKSGNAKLSKSMKEASPLYKKHNGKTGKHRRHRGGADEPVAEPVVVEKDTTEPVVVEKDTTEPVVAANDTTEPVIPEKVEEPVIPEKVEEPVVAAKGGRSKKRKGSKKSKTRRR